MGVQPPFLYDSVKTEGPRSPYKEFDPKAVTRASNVSRAPRPKPEGPLISFNQHPDSYMILPYGNSGTTPMGSSVKKWVKWMRIIQLVLRCIELLAAVGLLVMMILIRGVDLSTGWILRITPAVATLHALYGIYHLSRKASGRPPASSMSYQLFASFFDVSITPFYAFGALVAHTKNDGWTTILQNEDLITTFTTVIFFGFAVSSGLHLVSLAISIYLGVTFRKITMLPPDMNPLEDNLTSRHKRNKSSMSVAPTAHSEKRLSMPLESKRASGAAYQDLSRPPSIPFFHTRTQSTTSFSTYKSTPPPSRDSRLDLPSRQYQVRPSNSPRSSLASQADVTRNSGYNRSATLKGPKRSKTPSYESVPLSDYMASHVDYDVPKTPSRSSLYTPPKRASYGEVHGSDSEPTLPGSPQRDTHMQGKDEPWYTADSISSPRVRNKTHSPRKSPTKYQPLHQRHDSTDDFSSFGLPNPLEANPPTPRHSVQPAPPSPVSPLSEISNNTNSNPPGKAFNSYKDYTYSQRYNGINDGHDISDMSYEPETTQESFRTKCYGELKPGTPPIMIGGKNNRQVSSGNDFGDRSAYQRDVSGKVAEEGRGGQKTWGTRLRKISGL